MPAIPVRTKERANQYARKFKKQGKKRVRITKIDKRALAARMGNKYWVAYD